MWRRLLPYAAALWAMNLLTNVFALSDRYMILHLLPATEFDGQAAVGQYHSARIIPMLMMSLATMVSGVLMPYLSADWEAGRRDAVRQRIRRILFGVSATFTAGAGAAMLIAPWFFAEFLENRYSDGLSLLPMAFVFSIWVALATIGQDYLWVAERGKLVAIAIGTGLVVNVILNLFLLPVWGLHGAVVATLVANGIVLLGLWLAMAHHGYPVDQTTFYVTILPATILAGPWAAIICVLVSSLGSAEARHWLVDAIQFADRKVVQGFGSRLRKNSEIGSRGV
jgi:O-antigen/teichoic acid export membrane protein